jgi:KRAB domain-containing zinc finger protein
MKSHSGKQRFACEECEYKTDHPNDIREHMATVHEAEAPFACSFCEKKFKLERRLRQHELEHKDEYPNACEFCEKKFATSRTLRIHKERKHAQVPVDRNAAHGVLAEFSV